jgi:hypothetical protein
MATDQCNIAFWVSLNGSASGDGSQQNPFNSIEAAQAAVRAILASPAPLTSDIVVNIGGGTYHLDQPLSFGAADSGRDGHVVHYRAVAGEHPEISGGMAVTGWSPVADPHLTLAPGAQLWQANVGPGLASNQLYIDGQRATLAETNAADSGYPLGFRPTYYDKPGVSGIEYAVDSHNNANWQDPTTWTNVNDIRAVVYDQWKMISVPLKDVQAPSSAIPSLDPTTAPTVGLIDLLDPAWTNANLIRGLPTGSATSGSTTIQLDGTLAAPNIHVGMTVAGVGAGSDIDLGTVIGVDVAKNQIQVSVPWHQADSAVTLSIVDPATHQVLGQPNEWSFWRVSKFVNAYQFLDQPNEWYLDRSSGKLYLVTQAGDDPNQHDIELPVQQKLIDGNGASNLSFEGLSFKYATWLDPTTVTQDSVLGPTADGYVSDQAGFHLTGDGHEVNQIGHFEVVTRTPGNISFQNGTGITFTGDAFSHLGGVALDFSGGAQNDLVSHNIFQDISSTAVQIGGVNAEDARPASDSGITRDNLVDGNVITNVANEYIDAPAIFLGYSQNTRINGNFISDVSWSGISVGWGWGLRDEWSVFDPSTGRFVNEGSFPGLDGAQPGQWGFNTTPTIMRDNQVVGNTITNFLQKAWDGGAIYTTGFQDGNPADLGLHGTLISENYAYNKAPYGGGNVFYTDGGSRYLELSHNISFGNPIGNVNFGPVFDPNDPLNANNPFKVFPELNVLKYGSDIGGCVTYGDILYSANLWQNWWLANVFSQNPSQFPLNPLYYDPGRHGTTNDPLQDLAPLPGAPYPTDLIFQSNTQVAGFWGAPFVDVPVNQTLAFVRPTAMSIARADDLGGQVTFGLQSLSDGHVMPLLQNAEGRSAGALSYDSVFDGSWRFTQGQPFGSTASVSIGADVWLPFALLDGQPLALTSLKADGNSAFATFEGGYQADFTLGGSRSIANGEVTDHVVVTVQRLADYNNGLAFYEADQSTGRIEVDGQSLLPGDPGYLQGALTLARESNLVLDATQLPANGQQAVFDHLPLNDTRNYSLLMLVQNDPGDLFSSYAAANPDGAVQVVALGDGGHGVTFGMEDVLVTSGHSDRDYNDLLVTIGGDLGLQAIQPFFFLNGDSLTTAEQQSELIYVAFFGRAADPVGINFWINTMNSGQDIYALALDFSKSTEAQNTYPFLAFPSIDSSTLRQSFINSIYTDLFNRSADSAGLAYWDNELHRFQTDLANGVGSPPGVSPQLNAADYFAQRIGNFIMNIIQGAQNGGAGQDITTIQNKDTVALYFTDQLIVHNVSYANNQPVTIDNQAHDLVAQTTSSAGSVATQEAAVDSAIASDLANHIMTTATIVGLTTVQDFQAAWSH